MSKQKIKSLVPALRFPKFLNEGEWKDVGLGENEISTFVKDRIPLDQLNLENYVSTENLLQDFAGVSKASKLPSTGSFVRYKTGDILVSNIRPYLKKVWAATNEGGASNDVVVIRAEKKVSASFLRFLLINDRFIYYVMKSAKGVKMPRGDISLMKEYPVAIPDNLEEQRVIADCLFRVDELITAESKKLDALKAHKKGLMQKLFPAKGKTVPELRFPEFRGKGEWSEIHFYDLFVEVLDFRGRTPKKLGMDWGGGNIVSLSANNVKNGYIDFDAECNLGSQELYKKWMGQVNLEEGDIVFTMEAPLGNALLVPDSNKYILSQRVVAFKTAKEINNSFLIQLIWNRRFQDEITKLSTGSTAKGINQKTLKKVLVRIPHDKLEQQQISSCLASIDDLITAQLKKLEGLKDHKQGLMLQLFPSMDEE